MLRRASWLCRCCGGPAPRWPATVVDATGRSVEVPEQIARVLPAGPPAAILLAALAPDLMLGWTSPVSDNARALSCRRTQRGCRRFRG